MRTSRVRSSETLAACGMPTSLAGLDEATLHANELVLEKLLGSRPLLGLLAQAEQDELRRQHARAHARTVNKIGPLPGWARAEGAGGGGAHVSKRLREIVWQLRRRVIEDLREEHKVVRAGVRGVRELGQRAFHERYAQRPDVGGKRVRLATESLWRHVGVRANKGGAPAGRPEGERESRRAVGRVSFK